MRTYRPALLDPKDETQLLREFQAIQQAAQRAEPFIELEVSHAAPTKLRNGMVALADGTDWDPGSGAGFYGYYGGAWVKLG